MPRDTERAAPADPAVPSRGAPATDRPPAEIPASAAVAAALCDQAEVILTTMPGVADGTDTEALHDLRVAVRRARALLKLAGDVLPEPLVLPAAAELRRLGAATTPVRDLDVLLVRLGELAPRLRAATPADLTEFTTHVRRQRNSAHRAMMRELRGNHFTEFVESWRTELAAVAAGDRAGTSDITLKTLADTRIPRIGKKVRRRARAITGSAADTEIHRLRKRGKELRYLLEFCAPVTRPRKALRELRKLQNVLGDYQDAVVQRRALPELTEQLLSTATASAATVLAVGESAGLLAADQRHTRGKLAHAVHRFLRPRSIRRFASVTT
ncbi:CHAD domain-containing protein [Nocardia stercoris]|uniref:CHAD domain-containing protein n=1 Tax=Nocardia stercoris TaxID=2483361 RepID=A0A3M2LD08_9NOCA|nr:CHAD domain-containing protein [Nocardia stercoris]RMI35362.1 CHAD domain-containing protein [Nocardia stercoris]